MSETPKKNVAGMGTSGQNSHMPMASGHCTPALASVACTSQHQSCGLESRCFQIPTYLGTGTLKILPWSCCQRHWRLPHPLEPCVANLLGRPHVPLRGQLSSPQPPLPTFLSPPLSSAPPYSFMPQATSCARSLALRFALLPLFSLVVCCLSASLHSCLSFLACDVFTLGSLQQIHSPCLSTLSCRGVLSLWLSSPTQHLLTWLSRGHLCACLPPTTYSRILKLVSWHRFLGKALFVSVLKYICQEYGHSVLVYSWVCVSACLKTCKTYNSRLRLLWKYHIICQYLTTSGQVAFWQGQRQWSDKSWPVLKTGFIKGFINNFI